ncbi:MAG: DNA-binding response regulator, partial [Bdellovibrionales bacterium CG12_big_fil_rev_8_21_14_0_65_38_15]
MQKERILIVEDEEHIAEGLRINLSLQGFEVQVAIDGAKGLAAWRSFKPHLLVVDLMMPVMDGNQLVSNIRAEDKKVPILILTAKDASKDKIKLLEKGVDDYLTKPFVLDEFLLRVNRLIEKSRWYRGTEGEVVIFGNDNENVVDF